MSVYTCKCPDCGEDAQVWFGDLHFGGRGSGAIRSSISFYCSNCGRATEGDGRRLTGNLRVMHLEQEGTWAIQISNSKDRISVIKVIREIFELSMRETAALIKSDASIFTIGTKAESYYAQDLLKSYGVTVEIVRVEEC